MKMMVFACGSIVKMVSKQVTACTRSTCDVDECSVLVFASSIASFVGLSFDSNELVVYEDKNDAFAGYSIATLVSKVINACIGSNHDVDELVVVVGA